MWENKHLTLTLACKPNRWVLFLCSLGSLLVNPNYSRCTFIQATGHTLSLMNISLICEKVALLTILSCSTMALTLDWNPFYPIINYLILHALPHRVSLLLFYNYCRYLSIIQYCPRLFFCFCTWKMLASGWPWLGLGQLFVHAKFVSHILYILLALIEQLKNVESCSERTLDVVWKIYWEQCKCI